MSISVDQYHGTSFPDMPSIASITSNPEGSLYIEEKDLIPWSPEKGDWVVPLTDSTSPEYNGHSRIKGKAYQVAEADNNESIRLLTENGGFDGNGYIQRRHVRRAEYHELPDSVKESIILTDNKKKGIVQKLISTPNNSGGAYPERSIVLYYNNSCEFIPLYSVNKPISYNFLPDEYTKEKLRALYKRILLKKNKTYLDFINAGNLQSCSYIEQAKEESKRQINQILTEKTPDLYSTEYYVDGTRSRIFSSYCYSSYINLFQTPGIDFISKFGMLMDNSIKKVLFCVVLKKEYLKKLKYQMLLGKDISEDILKSVQLWVRKDFITSDRYSFLQGEFKKEFMTPFTDEGIEVCIKSSFDELFLNIQRPDIQSIKKQKEYFEEKSAKILVRLRERNKLKQKPENIFNEVFSH